MPGRVVLSGDRVVVPGADDRPVVGCGCDPCGGGGPGDLPCDIDCRADLNCTPITTWSDDFSTWNPTYYQCGRPVFPNTSACPFVPWLTHLGNSVRLGTANIVDWRNTGMFYFGSDALPGEPCDPPLPLVTSDVTENYYLTSEIRRWPDGSAQWPTTMYFGGLADNFSDVIPSGIYVQASRSPDVPFGQPGRIYFNLFLNGLSGAWVELEDFDAEGQWTLQVVKDFVECDNGFARGTLTVLFKLNDLVLIERSFNQDITGNLFGFTCGIPTMGVGAASSGFGVAFYYIEIDSYEIGFGTVIPPSP